MESEYLCAFRNKVESAPLQYNAIYYFLDAFGINTYSFAATVDQRFLSHATTIKCL